MVALERVMQMKQMGMREPEIIESLKQDGASPREITEALSQSQIKSAINTNTQQQDNNQEAMTEGMHGSMMQSSIMTENHNPPPQQDTNYPPAEQSYQGGITPAPEYQEEQVENNPEEAYQEYYPDYQPQEYSEYQAPGSMDVETIREICEQIIEEKIDKIRQQMTEYTKFKELTSFEVDNSNKRLEKLENSIEELKMAILRRIGDYGRDIQSISKEMHSTQESFSKILDPLADNILELKKITGINSLKKEPIEKEKQDIEGKKDNSKISEERQSPLKKPKIDFESYLR